MAAFRYWTLPYCPPGQWTGIPAVFRYRLAAGGGDSINILCCYRPIASYCLPVTAYRPANLTCIPPPDVVAGCNAVPAFDPFNPADLHTLRHGGGGNCGAPTWQELPLSPTWLIVWAEPLCERSRLSMQLGSPAPIRASKP